MLWSKKIAEGESIPQAYGITYEIYATRITVCHPIPVNVVISMLRRLYRFFMFNFVYQGSTEEIIQRESHLLYNEDCEKNKQLLREALNLLARIKESENER